MTNQNQHKVQSAGPNTCADRFADTMNGANKGHMMNFRMTGPNSWHEVQVWGQLDIWDHSRHCELGLHVQSIN